MGNTILFVDDEVVILKALKAVFSREGFQALTATSGEEALKILEHEDVDVVVSDERMPGISGIELLSEIKERYPDKIRIVLTAYAELNTMLSAINKVEAHRLIVKPYRNDEIVQTIRDLIVKREKCCANETALQAAKREADFAYRAAKIMCSCRYTVHEKYSQVVHLVRNYIRANALSLMLLHSGGEDLVVQAATNQKIVGLKRKLNDRAVSCWVAREGKPILHNEGEVPNREAGLLFHDQTLSRYRYNTFLCVPVMDEARIMGVFNLADPESGRISAETERTVVHLMRWVGAMVPTPPLDAQPS